MIIMPVVVLIIAVTILLSSFGGALSSALHGGEVTYSEDAIQDYADEQYAAEFGNSAAYEDHILLVFLTCEDNYYFYYIPWIGDNITGGTRDLFDSRGELNRALNSYVNSSSYKYSLDSDLAKVVDHMKDQIVALDDFSYHTAPQADSHLTNKTTLELTQSTVDTALESFTEATGISFVIVVDESEDVFGRTMSGDSIFALIIAVALIVLAIWLIVRAVKNRNRGDDNGNFQNGNRSWNNTNYNNGGW